MTRAHCVLFQPVVVILLTAGALRAQAPPAEPAEPEFRTGRIAAKAVGESSGLVASRRHAGVFWTVNDSGNDPVLYAISREGELIAAFPVDAKNVDWEDLAIDDDGHLYVADVGNNDGRRTEVRVLRVDEPDPRGGGGDAAPAKGDAAPKKEGNAPGKGDRASNKAGNAPAKGDGASNKGDDSPGKGDGAPPKGDAAPNEGAGATEKGDGAPAKEDGAKSARPPAGARARGVGGKPAALPVTESWRLTYPGKPFDCEALAVHDGAGYLISKRRDGGAAEMFRFDLAPPAAKPVALERVAALPVRAPVTAADVSADGKRLAVLTVLGPYVFDVNGDVASAGRDAPLRYSRYFHLTMEAACFVPGGLLVTAETRDVFFFADRFFKPVERAGEAGRGE